MIKSMTNTRLLTAIVFSLTAAIAPYAPAQSANADIAELRFPGGKLAEYVRAVRTAVPDANIVLEETAATAGFTVPPLHLRHVRLHEVLELLPHVVTPPDADAEPPVQRLHLDVRLVGGSIWTVRSLTVGRHPQAPGGGRPAPEPAARTRVMAIADILQRFSAEDVFTSIETALGLEEVAEPPPVLRLHDATGLLVVRGTVMEVSLVQSVVVELRAAAEQWGPEPRERLERWRQEAERLKLENAGLREHADQLRRRLAQLSGQRGAGEQPE